MKRVLVVVDMQKDFVDGSLGTKEAQAIVPQVTQTIEDQKYDTVFVTMDTHEKNYLDTFEGKHLPVKHCVKDTEGWQLNEKVQQALNGRHPVIVEKPTFGSYELVRKVEAVRPDEITLIGLCTDICVISNALLLRAAMPSVKMIVIKDACAGVTSEKHQAALEVMQSCQIEIQ